MEKYSDDIVYYLYGQMEGLQREAFEEAMKNDAALAEEVERRKVIYADIRATMRYKDAMEDPDADKAIEAAKKYLARREKRREMESRPAKSIIVLRLFLNAAAIIILFFLNRATMQITKIHPVFIKSLKSFRALWKMLWMKN